MRSQSILNVFVGCQLSIGMCNIYLCNDLVYSNAFPEYSQCVRWVSSIGMSDHSPSLSKLVQYALSYFYYYRVLININELKYKK